MLKIKCLWVIVMLAVLGSAFPLFAEMAENVPENSFNERIVNAYNQSADLINKGLREVRETFVTDGALIAYEANDSLVDGQELLDEVAAWTVMYTSTVPEDVVRLKKIKDFIWEKHSLVQELVDVVGTSTTNVNEVVNIKRQIKSLDKKFAFQVKALKGPIALIPNKPLPAEAQK